MTLSQYRCRLGKCWQGSTPFILLQAECNGNRGFLQIDLRRKPAHCAWLAEKPDDILPAGAIAALIRKYIPTARLNHIWLEKSHGLLLLPLVQGLKGNLDPHVTAWILIQPNHSGLAELSLIVEGLNEQNVPAWTTVARFSAQGMFTKKYTFTQTDLLQSQHYSTWADILPTLNADNKNLSHVAPETQLVLPLYQRTARDRLARRVKTLRKTKVSLSKKMSSKEDANELRKRASALKEHAWQIKPGDFEVQLPDQTTVQLDPELSIGQQIDDLFKEARRAERTIDVGGKRLATLEKQIEQAEETLSQLRREPLAEDTVCRLTQPFLESRQSAPPASTRANAATRSGSVPSSRFITSAVGVRIYFGRTAIENDQLTKSAKSNDWWLHAVGTQGAHVIVPSNELKEKGRTTELPEQLLRAAAIIALHYSSQRSNRSGEVYVTKRQNLRKQKGMPAGLWSVLRSETIQIKYDQSEVDQLLGGVG